MSVRFFFTAATCFALIVSSSGTVADAPLINEIFYKPDSSSRDKEKRQAFIELYRPKTSFDLSTCSLANADGSFTLHIPAEAAGVDQPYFTILEQSGKEKINVKIGTLTTSDISLRDIDGLALFCDDEMKDYVAWGVNGTGPNGVQHDAAVLDGQWRNELDFVETSPEGNIEGRLERGVLDGDSLGRDASSTDGDGPDDWLTLGGMNATGPTPGARNLDQNAPFFFDGNSFMVNDLVGESTGDNEPSCSLWKQAKGRLRRGKLKKQCEKLKKQRGKPGKLKKHPNLRRKADWTIMTYLDTRDKKFRNYLNKALKDIASEGSTNKVHFVAQWKSTRGNYARRARLTTGMDFKRDVSAVGQHWRPDDGETLAEFIKWAETNYKANNYALHIMGHGKGWKGTCSIGRENLSMSEISGALDALGKKFAVVYFESCLMGGLEVAYQLMDRAQYVTFSEEVMWTVTKYRPWAKEIKKERRRDAKGMATLLAERYYEDISRARKSLRTISVVDLSRVRELSDALYLFAAALIIDMANYMKPNYYRDNLNIIWGYQVLRKAEAFYDRNFVDLWHLAELVKPKKDFLASAFADDVITKVNLAVVVEKHLDGGPNQNAHGLHIYHPKYLTRRTSKRDPAYDNTYPSKTLYALDSSARIPKVFTESHSEFIDPDFMFTAEQNWDEFLNRFYKPTANACILMKKQCVREATLEIGEKKTISGLGSSDGDADVGIQGISKYWWDKDISVDSGGDKPAYADGSQYRQCTKNEEDCDRDNLDGKNDDPDDEGSKIEYTCEEVGTKTIRLIVWDRHHLYRKKYDENEDHNDGRHWLHFQVDSETVNITCTSPAAIPSAAPSVTPSVAPSVVPTGAPTISPSFAPSAAPTSTPFTSPSSSPPSVGPSIGPFTAPFIAPTSTPSISSPDSPSLPAGPPSSG